MMLPLRRAAPPELVRSLNFKASKLDKNSENDVGFYKKQTTFQVWIVRSLRIVGNVDVSYSAYDVLSTIHKICVPLFYGSAILLKH